MARITVDKHGHPIMLADVPNSGAATVDPDAKSGNPRHDTASGKFSSGSRKRSGTSQAQANIDPVELAMMKDAARDAARQFDEMTGEDAQEFLEGRVRDMDSVDFAQFLGSVRAARIDDLADVLEQQIRSSARNSLRPKKGVRITAPRGYTKRVFAGLDDEEVLHLAIRMQRRGISDEQISKNLLSRVQDPERRQALIDTFGERADAYRVKRRRR